MEREVFNKLKAAKSFDEFIAVAQKYNLPSAQVGEFLPTNVQHNFWTLRSYTDLDCVPILQLLKNNKEYANEKLSATEALQVFVGLNRNKASSHAEIIDSLNKQRAEQMAKAIAEPVKDLFNDPSFKGQCIQYNNLDKE